MTQSNVVVTGPNAIEGTYKNIVLKSGIGFEEQTREGYCIYHVKWDYDLGGTIVDIPANVVISMEGGVISNGTLVGHDTQIIYDVPVDKAFVNVELEGTWIDDDDKQDARISELERISGNRTESTALPTHMGRITLKPNIAKRSNYWFVYPYTYTKYGHEITDNILVYFNDNKYYLPRRYADTTPVALTVAAQDNVGEIAFSAGANIEDVATALNLQSGQYLSYDPRTKIITMPDLSTVNAWELVNDNWPLKNYTKTDANLLTQQMISKPNTIYVIQYDYELATNITVPANCILEFDGGSISAGIGETANAITCNNTGIKAGLVKIFDTSITIKGKLNLASFFVEWYGAIGDGTTICTDAIQKTLNLNKDIIQREQGLFVQFGTPGTYLIDNTLNVYPFTSVIGADIQQMWLGMTAVKQVNNAPNFKLCKTVVTADQILIKDIAIIGNGIDNEYCCGITNDDDVEYVHFCSFENLRLKNLRYGIKFTCGCCMLNFKNIHNKQNDYTGFNIYIDATRTSSGSLLGYLWGCSFIDCGFSHSRIGAVYIKHAMCITTPCIFKNCCFEVSGHDYKVAEHHEYGTFGVYYEFLGNGGSSLTFEDCYFEGNEPYSFEGDIIPNDYGYVEARVTNGCRYITNPNEERTGQLVIKTTPDNIVNVNRCHFSTCYQAMVVSNGGNFNCTDCTFQALNIGLPTYPPLSWNGKSIIKLKIVNSDKLSLKFHCPIATLKEQSSYTQAYYFFSNVTHVLSFIGTPYLSYANIDIYCPILGDYSQWHSSQWSYSGNRPSIHKDSIATIYVDPTAESNGIGIKDFPINSIPLFMYTFLLKNYCKTIRFVLLNDFTIQSGAPGYAYSLPPSFDYEFVGINSDIVFRAYTSSLTLNHTKCKFAELNMRWGSDGIICNSSDITFDNCKFLVDNGNRLVKTYGLCKISVTNPTLVLSEGYTSFILSRRINGQQYVNISRVSSETLSKIKHDGHDNTSFIDVGTARPTLTSNDAGYQFFDKGLDVPRPIYWTGTIWVDATGTQV